jgi:hypothetical protein
MIASVLDDNIVDTQRCYAGFDEIAEVIDELCIE